MTLFVPKASWCTHGNNNDTELAQTPCRCFCPLVTARAGTGQLCFTQIDRVSHISVEMATQAIDGPAVKSWLKSEVEDPAKRSANWVRHPRRFMHCLNLP